MSQHVIMLLCVATSACCASAQVNLDAASDRPPNIVFILADDLGCMDIGAANDACFYETPNIDRLAASGVRFTNAYATCPVCSPTRASILTGRYPARCGITDYISPTRGNQPERWSRPTPLLPAPFATELALEEITIAELLRAHGYATFFAGKWHLGGDGFSPEDQGFDVNRGGIARGGPYGGGKYFAPYGNPKLEDGPVGEHLPARLADETAAFMAAHAKSPFFAYLSFYSVHTPLMGRPDLVEKYRLRSEALEATEPSWRPEGARRTRLVQNHAVYAAMVEAMDAAIGHVLDTLDELHLADHTIVVFFSDNGGLSTSEGHPTSNEPYRAGKGWLYEGGIREPCIIRAPGLTPPGALCHTAITSTDFLPTLLDLAGVTTQSETTDQPGRSQDGISLKEVLREPSASLPREAIYWHYPHYGNQGGSPGGAIRAGRWKLIEFYEDGRRVLYDLVADPSEINDLASEQPEIVTRLHERLQRWRQDVGAVMPTPRAGE